MPPSASSRRTAVIAGAAAVSALATILLTLELHRRRRTRLWDRYVGALKHIAASAGAARTRKGQQARAAEGGEDDATRWRRRRGFFARFFKETLGAVEGDFKFVHVTGTKGKGTVCELVRCGLVAHGKRVGTFTSPHLHTVRERIRVGDELIPEADFVRLWDTVQAVFAQEEGSEGWCCFFDRVLALALAYFVEQRVEYIVLEVGIGGRYDPTNFIEAPTVSVITSISYDHVELLGRTLEAIAWQKAGIIKRGRPVLTPDTQDPAVLHTLRVEAAALHAPLHEIPILDDQLPPITGRGHCYPVNVALAKAALRLLLLLSPPAGVPPLTSGSDVDDAGGDPPESLAMAAADDAVLTKGWDKAFWPGRFEVFAVPVGKGVVTVVLDVAHNVDSVARLLAEARGRFFSPSSSSLALWVLFGTGNDKDAVGMLAELVRPPQGGGAAPIVQRLALCQAAHARAVPVDALAGLAARAKSTSPSPSPVKPAIGDGGDGGAGETTTTVIDVGGGAGGGLGPEAALERLLEAAGSAPSPPVVLLVCGSFYVVAAARAHLAATRPGLFASRRDWAFHPDPPLSK